MISPVFLSQGKTIMKAIVPLWKTINTCEIRTHTSTCSKTTNSDLFEGDDFRRYEFGLSDGPGAEYRHCGIEVRYEWSNGASGVPKRIL